MSIVEMTNYSQKTVDFHYYHFPLSYHLTSQFRWWMHLVRNKEALAAL